MSDVGLLLQVDPHHNPEKHHRSNRGFRICNQLGLLIRPPLWILSDNGKQFNAKFFLDVCRVLETAKLFTTLHDPHDNGQVDQFNQTIIEGLRHSVADHSTEWNLDTQLLNYAYKTPVHRTTQCTPFELVLSKPPQPLAIAPSQWGRIPTATQDLL